MAVVRNGWDDVWTTTASAQTAERVRRAVELAARIPPVTLTGDVEIDEVYVVAGHKGQPAEVAKRGGRDGAAG